MLLENHLSSASVTADSAQPTAQNSLNARHYKECIEKRGLNPQWILANCFSVTANEASQKLGYTAQSDGIRLEGCNHQSQFKPDRPWKLEGDLGRPPKYRSSTGEYDAMLPKHPTIPDYWTNLEALKERCYKVDGNPCLTVSEGFFKSIAGCDNDIPTIGLLGVEMGLTSGKADPQGKRYLVPTLEHYALAGFGFIIANDADCATNENVINAQRQLAAQLKLFKVPVYSATGLWAVEQGKGMDDYIQNHGGEHFKREILGKVVDISAWERQFQKPEPESGGSGQDILKEIEDRFAGRFRLNRLTAKVELDGKPIRVDEYYITLRRKFGLKANKQFIIDLVMQLARENEYSPVAEYLESVSLKHKDDTVSLLDNMACRYFGTTEPLFDLYVRRTLIGAVARALNPGCKVDTALILQGKQGLHKSSFFSTLVGVNQWFDDSLGNASDKDERLKLRAHWMLEWAELERAFSRRSTGDVKSFLSSCVDNLRVPYGRTVEAFPRHCVFVGSTNEEEFLADSTGDRRFWVIPVQQNIDCKLLASERDLLWAAAVALYRKSERWWFESDEQVLSQVVNQRFHVADSWMQYIRDYVDALPDSVGFVKVYVRDILTNCLDIDKAKQDKGSQMRVAGILKRLGFTRKPDSRGNPCWNKVLSPPRELLDINVQPLNPTTVGMRDVNDDEGCTFMSSDIVTPLPPLIPTVTPFLSVPVPSNQAIASVSASLLTPTDTFDQTSTENVGAIVEQSEKINVGNLGVGVTVLSVGDSSDVIPMVPAIITDTVTPAETTGRHTVTPNNALEIDQPQQPLALPVAEVSVGVGDSITDKSGRFALISGLARGGWLTSTGDYVSRSDILQGTYIKVNPPTETAVLPSDEWDTPDNVEALTEWLNACESSEMLADVRKAYPQPQALKAACKGLDAFKVQQIAEWVVELNSQPENQ